MCNTYVAKPRNGAAGLQARVADDLAKLKSTLIRKSDPGVVVIPGKTRDADPTPHTMRWGFHRPFNPSINNTRSDKLDSPVWKTAFENRRCLIPVSAYYEWSDGTGGRKQAYEITLADDPDDDWLWIAGFWEENPELGRCYSMITTAAAESVQHIHDRMPAVLHWKTAAEFLGCENFGFAPISAPLTASPCPSPLVRKKPDHGPTQGNLF